VRQLDPTLFAERVSAFLARDFALSNQQIIPASEMKLLLGNKLATTVIEEMMTTRITTKHATLAFIGDRTGPAIPAVAERVGMHADAVRTELNAALANELWLATAKIYDPIERTYYLYLVSPKESDAFLEIRDGAPAPIIGFPDVSPPAHFSMGSTAAITTAPMAFDPFSVDVLTTAANGDACIDKQQTAWARYEWYECPQANADGAVCLGTIRVFGAKVWIYPDAREQIIAPALVNTAISMAREKWENELGQICKPQQ